MKKSAPFILLLAILATLSGYMLHKVSWIGRIGIKWFYSEYSIFKSWWKSSLLVFILFIVLFLLHHIINKTTAQRKATIFHITGLLLSLCGLYYTYHDFRHDLSHRIAGERFHIGFYLFWIGWTVIALRFIFISKHPVTTSGNKAASNQ